MAAWNREEVEFLIHLVRERPTLYNVKDINYKSKVKRGKEMESVAQELCAIRPNTTAEECRRKWRALRTNYMAEKRKVHASKASGAGADTVRTPSLYYYEATAFLEETMAIRPHTSPLEVTEESSVPGKEGEWELLFGEDGSVLEVQDTSDTPSPAPSDSSRSIAGPSSSAARGKKRKTESPMPEQTVELLQAAATALGTLVDQGACEESEEDAYGKLVAQRLKGISDRREKSRVMFEIEKLFFNSSMNRE
ncbi:uncharacterized protein LOC124164218 [Ischnura elegans]|uniref:uncharacterized protein LOC124164218 n=1 Tax=Ischnura elegans TaxID=197161 RepID=UPI001ED8B4CD|nr:uncharacterized protein LOC124164218 [Ischnura elegans]